MITVSRGSDRIAWLSAAATVLLIAACDAREPAAAPAPGAAPTASPTSVCDWLSDASLAQVLGETPASSAPTAGLRGCVWKRADGMPLVQLTIAPNAARSAQDYRDALARELGEDWNDDDLRPVDGLGDWAFYMADARLLLVFRGRGTLQIMAGGGEGEAMALARIVLDRDW